MLLLLVVAGVSALSFSVQSWLCDWSTVGFVLVVVAVAVFSVRFLGCGRAAVHVAVVGIAVLVVVSISFASSYIASLSSLVISPKKYLYGW